MVGELTRKDIEEICMKLISYAGEGRALVYDAIQSFQEDDCESCGKKIEEAEKFLVEAHKIQFEKILTPQAKGIDIPFNVLIVHAMDLLMVSTAEKDVIKKIYSGAIRRGEK